ncbi:MAG: mercuric reductase [Taibaiella sp.]|jgi:pyruvate/2-oxoglutarate dehydrogenase complex dihydrolipoamide dehydrogenase (E3) component
MNHYDAIIIGSGQGGTPLSIRLAKAGYKTALIEKRAIGGTCINDGCIPSKTLIASAKAAYAASKARELGVYGTENYIVNFKEIVRRKRGIVEQFRKGSEASLEKAEMLDVIYGTATFTGEKQISVTTKDGESVLYSADYFFINTGARPFIPDIPGLKNIDYLTSTSIMELEQLPHHLIIVGAGYVSLEFAQAFRRFGSKITIIEQHDHILEKEDEDVRQAVSSFLEEEKITILTGAAIEDVSTNSMNDVVIRIVKDGTHAVITGSHILMASGRIPNTDILKPEAAGIAVDEHGYIKVDDKLQTNIDRIYAIGDVKGGMAFTHVSYNDYRIVYRNLVEKAGLSTNGRLIPYCMFTDPELGRIGITEAEARKKNMNIAVAKLEMKNAARGIIENKTKGFLKAVIDKDSKKILGASLLCKDGGEIMSVLQMAMQAGFTYEQVKEHVFAHPTLSESLNNLFFSLDK